jgi:hypothetical protein
VLSLHTMSHPIMFNKVTLKLVIEITVTYLVMCIYKCFSFSDVLPCYCWTDLSANVIKVGIGDHRW